jgi:hypothetical protein
MPGRSLSFIALLIMASPSSACVRGAPSEKPAGPQGAVTSAPDAGVPAEAPQDCGQESATRKYTARSPEECSLIRFVCEPGWGYFSDDCGCGCEKQP